MKQMISAFLIATAVLLPRSANEDTAAEHVKKAKELLDQGKFDEALDHVGSAIRLDPKCAEAYFVRASLRDLDLKYDDAISDLTEVIRLNPRFPKAYSERAFRYVMKDDWDQAERDYTEAIRVDPSDPGPLSSRSMIYYDKEQYEKALADAKKAVQVSQDGSGQMHLALMLAACPDPQYRDGKKALEHAKRAVELRSKRNPISNGYEVLAAAYAELGQFEEAVKWQRKKIEELEKDGSSLLETIIKEQNERLRLYEDRKPLRLRKMFSG